MSDDRKTIILKVPPKLHQAIKILVGTNPELNINKIGESALASYAPVKSILLQVLRGKS